MSSPLIAPSNETMIIDVARRTACILCAKNWFKALHVLIHLILIISHFEYGETEAQRLYSCSGKEQGYELQLSGCRAGILCWLHSTELEWDRLPCSVAWSHWGALLCGA